MKQDCQKYIEQINLLIDDSLNGKDKERLLKHIFSCPSCEIYYRDQLFIKNNIKSIELSLPPDFASLLMAKIKIEKSDNKIKKVKFRKFIKYSVSAIAACLVVVTGIFLFSNNMLLSKVSEDSTMVFEQSNQMSASGNIELADSALETDEYGSVYTNEINSERAPLKGICAMIQEYDYLYESNQKTIKEITTILENEFSITDYNLSDECVIFNTDSTHYEKIIDVLSLKQIENLDNLDEIIIIKIKYNNGE